MGNLIINQKQFEKLKENEHIQEYVISNSQKNKYCVLSLKKEKCTISFFKNDKNEDISISFQGKNNESQKKFIRDILEGIHILKYKAFMAMPFNKKYDDWFDSLKNLLSNWNIELIRIDQEAHSGIKDVQLLTSMEKCDFGIINISETNMNVGFEAGYLVKRFINTSNFNFNNVLFLKDKNSEETNFDLEHLSTIFYNSKLNILEEKSFIKKIKKEIEKILSINLTSFGDKNIDILDK